jgi:group II intron reverse transcriptase/maturase
MSNENLLIAERARSIQGEALYNLNQFITKDLLIKCFNNLNKNSAVGTDGKNWYECDLMNDVAATELLNEFKSGRYRAPSIRRVYVPKDKDSKRPIGIPTIRDKTLQSAVRSVLDPIYEQEFKPFSYGFRNKRSAHDALEYMFKEVSFNKMRYIIDADIKNYFGSINHGLLREFLDRRVKDGVIRKMIDKWLNAGILEDGQLSYPSEGTPQGGIISPVLSNVFLHYVLDEWFSGEIQPLLKGRSFIVRYADDYVLGFSDEQDAKRVMDVLPKRFEKYKLTLHPDKTRLIDLYSKSGDGKRCFDFLGFTHFLAKSLKGKLVLKRKTSGKKFTKAIGNTEKWIKENRGEKLKPLIKALNVRLRGHYNYYGITFNTVGVRRFYFVVKRCLFKWLNRRGGKRVWTWDRYTLLVLKWIPLLFPKIVHSFIPANPILEEPHA